MLLVILSFVFAVNAVVLLISYCFTPQSQGPLKEKSVQLQTFQRCLWSVPWFVYFWVEASVPTEPYCPTPLILVTAFILLAALVGTEYSSSHGLALYSPDTGGHFILCFLDSVFLFNLHVLLPSI